MLTAMNNTLLADLKNVHQLASNYRATDKPGELSIGCGICSNLYLSAKSIKQYYHSWPHWTGCYSYPVPESKENKDEHDAMHKYLNEDPKWAGPYGDLRMDLLEHIIQQVTLED